MVDMWYAGCIANLFPALHDAKIPALWTAAAKIVWRGRCYLAGICFVMAWLQALVLAQSNAASVGHCGCSMYGLVSAPATG